MADRICAELAEGRSLRTVCAPKDMPTVQTIFTWFRSQPTFLEQYARAKQEAADALVDETIDIADDGRNDWMERLGEDGKPPGYVLNGEHVQRSRLRVDTRKWIASKLKPKKYGERIETEVSGTVTNVNINAEDLSLLSDEEIEFMQAIHAKLALARVAPAK